MSSTMLEDDQGRFPSMYGHPSLNFDGPGTSFHIDGDSSLQDTVTGPIGYSSGMQQQPLEIASAPVSPTHSLIDLDLGEFRPSTAGSEVGSASTNGNPFDLEPEYKNGDQINQFGAVPADMVMGNAPELRRGFPNGSRAKAWLNSHRQSKSFEDSSSSVYSNLDTANAGPRTAVFPPSSLDYYSEPDRTGGSANVGHEGSGAISRNLRAQIQAELDSDADDSEVRFRPRMDSSFTSAQQNSHQKTSESGSAASVSNSASLPNEEYLRRRIPAAVDNWTSQMTNDWHDHPLWQGTQSAEDSPNESNKKYGDQITVSDYDASFSRQVRQGDAEFPNPSFRNLRPSIDSRDGGYQNGIGYESDTIRNRMRDTKVRSKHPLDYVMPRPIPPPAKVMEDNADPADLKRYLQYALSEFTGSMDLVRQLLAARVEDEKSPAEAPPANL
jgi:hypothetical protein